MASFSIKAGATFTLTGAATTDQGGEYDLTGATITSKVRDANGVVVASLTVTITSPANGIFTVVAADTSDWPRGLLIGDIKIAFGGGDVMFTDDFTINVTYPITQ